LEENVASIFKVQELTKQETSMKLEASLLPEYMAFYPLRWNSSVLKVSQLQNIIL
jgi:hypothetical protein